MKGNCMKKWHLVVMATLLSGCATSGGGAISETRSFSLDNGSKIVFDKSGCVPRSAKFINATDKNQRVSATIIASNSNENATIDEYMLSCSPAVAGGSSSCSMLRIRGDGGFAQYGGFGCPDMKFKLMSVRTY